MLLVDTRLYGARWFDECFQRYSATVSVNFDSCRYANADCNTLSFEDTILAIYIDEPGECSVKGFASQILTATRYSFISRFLRKLLLEIIPRAISEESRCNDCSIFNISDPCFQRTVARNSRCSAIEKFGNSPTRRVPSKPFHQRL